MMKASTARRCHPSAGVRLATKRHDVHDHVIMIGSVIGNLVPLHLSERGECITSQAFEYARLSHLFWPKLPLEKAVHTALMQGNRNDGRMLIAIECLTEIKVFFLWKQASSAILRTEQSAAG